MMRRGDKLASYRLLAQSLAMLSDLDWSLDVVGDGEARGEVATAFAEFGSRIRWRGALDESAVAAALAASDLFVWPAINEAFGMALLEAQASGLPVVAGASGGVTGIVADRETGLLARPGDAAGFAAALRHLMLEPDRRAALGTAARERLRREHDLPVAAARLRAVLAGIQARQAA
jgi:glycosyltransferase involved in cell wall biosynthesis